MELTNEKFDEIMARIAAEGNNPPAEVSSLLISTSGLNQRSKWTDRFYTAGRIMLAGLGLTTPVSIINACTAPQQVETRQVQTRSNEIVSLKSKIQVVHEKSSDGSLETWKVVASNPLKKQQAEFYFVNTIEDGKKKSTVVFPKDGKSISSDYRMAITTDSKQKAQLVYLVPNNSSFIDISLDIDIPEKIDDQFTQQVFDASENAETINGITITNLATGEQAVLGKEGDNDTFRGLLQALTAKKAQAAEMLVTPTETPTPTATIPATSTPETPKVVYWTESQILQAQKEAAVNHQTVILDTWSESSKNIKTEEAYSITNYGFMVINGFSKDQIFNSPVMGKVETIAVQTGGNRQGPKNRLLGIKVNDIIISIYLNWDDKILVQQGQNITLNTPLAELSGELLPRELGLSKKGQVAIAIDNPKFSKENLLQDSNGALVNLQK